MPIDLQERVMALPRPEDRRVFDDLRGAKRFSLLIRIATLVGANGEFLCVVRDVSETGVRLKLFHPLVLGDRLALKLANGESYFIEKVWESGDQAGFRFAAPIDVGLFIAEASVHARRPVRLTLNRMGWLEADGLKTPAMLANLSQHGAGLRCDEHLAVGRQITLAIEGLPRLVGHVCWRMTPGYGMVFRSYFSVEELALLVFAMQHVPSDKGLLTAS